MKGAQTTVQSEREDAGITLNHDPNSLPDTEEESKMDIEVQVCIVIAYAS